MSNIVIFSKILDEQIISSSIQTFYVGEIEFDIMALTKELTEYVLLEDTSSAMIEFAANNGLFYDGSRAIDNEELDLDAAWASNLIHLDDDISVKHQVGQKVFEISGLKSILDDKMQAEKDKRTQDLLDKGNLEGDGDTPDVDVDRLNEDAAVAQ
jgi:hypothetical protein